MNRTVISVYNSDVIKHDLMVWLKAMLNELSNDPNMMYIHC